MNKEFIDNLSQIPNNYKLALYGIGGDGINFLKLVKEERKDLEIIYLINDHKVLNDYKVYTLDAISLDNIDMIVVSSSFFWYSLVQNLDKKQIQKYKILNPYFNFLYNDKDFLEKHFFLDDTYSIKEYNDVKDIFTCIEDKILFDIVVDARSYELNKLIYLYEYYMNNFREKIEYLGYINKKEIAIVIEGGVYDGKNTLQFLENFPNITNIYGFEPFPKRELSLNKVKIENYALWDCDEIVYMKEDDQSSRIDGTEQTVKVNAINLDNFVYQRDIRNVDYIKLDIEGAELKALRGAIKLLKEFRPQLAICIYHTKNDIFDIPKFLSENLEEYIFRLGHYSTSIWDTVLYAIPKEKYGE